MLLASRLDMLYIVVLVKRDILQAVDHPSLVGFLEVAHTNMSNSSMPKPHKRRLGEEACHGSCLF